MALPLLIAGGTIAAGGLAGSIANARRRLRTPDIQPFLDQISQTGARQRELVTGLRPQLAERTAAFGRDVRAATDARQAEARASGQQFLRDIGQAASEQGQNLFDISKQRILETAPEQQQSLREALAATGGLQRGGASAAFGQLAREQASQIGQAQQAIATQELQARQQALQDVFGKDQAFITNALGLDAGTIQAIFSSDREDLKSEVTALIQELQDRRDATLGVLGIQQQRQIAADAARRDAQSQLFSSLTGLGGTLLGAGLTGSGSPDAQDDVSMPVDNPLGAGPSASPLLLELRRQQAFNRAGATLGPTNPNLSLVRR